MVQRALRHISDRALVVVALDVVKKIQAVGEDDVLRDAGFPDSGQHVGPHRAVVLLVACLDAGHQTRVEPNLHPAADSLTASWLRSQRSPLAMCAVAAARASSGSPSTIAS